jgi:hypothetical protein
MFSAQSENTEILLFMLLISWDDKCVITPGYRLKWDLVNVLPGLVLNCDLPDSWN